MEAQKALFKLADRLRVLTIIEKQSLLKQLDECSQNYHSQKVSNQKTDVFSIQRMALTIYNYLEGKPFTQPEFLSQMTQEDILARENFDAISSGVVSYVTSSEKDLIKFKKRMLKNPRLFERVAFLIKTPQNTRN